MKAAWPALLLPLLIATLAIRSLSDSRRHPYPIYDEVSYLDAARDFAQGGGVLHALGSYYQGTCLQEDRNPLILMALAPWMRVQAEDFTRGKLISLVFAIALILILYVGTKALWGEDAALVAAALASLSPTTSYFAQYVSEDMLFAVFYCAALLCTMAQSEPFVWPLFGSLAGAAYLAKANGHVLWCALAGRRPNWKTALVAVAAFLAISSPLWWRNLLVWGDPFHSLKVVWLDDWRQFYLLSEPEQWRQVGPLWYLRHHTLGQAVLRFAWGFPSAVRTLAFALGAGPSGRWPHKISAFLASCLVLAGLVKSAREKDFVRVALVLAPGLVLLTGFAWAEQPLGVPLRYVYPIAMSLLPFAGLAAVRLFPRAMTRGLKPCIVAGCLLIMLAHRDGFTAKPLELWSVSPQWSETTRWLERHAERQSILVDNYSLYSSWECCRDYRTPYPFDIPASQLLDYASRHGIRYAMLDRDAMALIPDIGQYGPRDEYGPKNFLGWRRCFHDRLKPSAYLIYGSECGGESE